MNITHDQDRGYSLEEKDETLHLILDEKKGKITRTLIIGKDIEIIGGPERDGEGFSYKFKAISKKAIRYFTKMNKK